MDNLVAWLKDNAIWVIIGLTIIVGAMVSILEVSDKQSLATVWSGLTFIVSGAILAAAITAAFYARPAYREAIAQQKPVELTLVGITVRDALDAEVSSTSTAGDYQVYSVPRLAVLTVRVSFRNAGPAPALCLLNFRIPRECSLTTIDDPSKGHYVTLDERWLDLMPGLSVKTKSSAAQTLVARDITTTFGVQVSLPSTAPSWPDGWPMEIVVRGVRETDPAIDESWWIKPQ